MIEDAELFTLFFHHLRPTNITAMHEGNLETSTPIYSHVHGLPPNDDKVVEEEIEKMFMAVISKQSCSQ